jgi:hypothetical protein
MRGIIAKPKALLFDLLTALIDSWTLWDGVAGNLHTGSRPTFSRWRICGAIFEMERTGQCSDIFLALR